MNRACVLILIAFLAGGATASLAVAAKPLSDRAVIKTDQINGRVEIIIDGQAVAVFDAVGLNVRHDLSYGGSLTNFSETGFIRTLGKTQKGNAHAR